jgi:hypothetical protein
MKTFLAAAAAPFAGLMMLSGGALAQDLTMGEQSVSAQDRPIVEDWCKELQAQQGLTGTNEPESTMTEEQAAAATATQGQDTTAATTASSEQSSAATTTTESTGEQTSTAAETEAEVSTATGGEAATTGAADTASEDRIDLTQVTLEMCQEAGLTDMEGE